MNIRTLTSSHIYGVLIGAVDKMPIVIYDYHMRVKLHINDLKSLKNNLLVGKKNTSNIAKEMCLNRKTLDGWINGKSTIPIEVYDLLLKKAGLTFRSSRMIILPNNWHNSEAGKKGGVITGSKYQENFGTTEGRSKGGRVSAAQHKDREKTNFKILKEYSAPRLCNNYAELLGILFGDGHLSEYQVSIMTNSETDFQHIEFIKGLFKELFLVDGTLRYKKNQKAVELLVSSKAIVCHINDAGMPIGNKLDVGLGIPDWIKKKKSFQKAFLRGLFDTDGCVYGERCKTKNKEYNYKCIAITSYSENLRNDIVDILKGRGYNPTNTKKQKSVFLRRQKEVVRFFEDIGSNNHKHLIRFFGEVPKRS